VIRSTRSTLIERVLQVGVLPQDEEPDRLRKRSLTALVFLIVLLSPIWVGTYLVLGRPLPAAIPAAYMVLSLASVLLLARTGRHGAFVGLAAPGTVEITGATAALLGDVALTEPHEAVEVKGKGMMTVYRLLAITPRAPAER